MLSTPWLAAKESEIACDLDAAKKMFKSNSKCYQVYRFLGLPLDQYLRQNRLTEEERLDLAIKVSQAVHHLHIGTQSRSHTCYAHLDLKPSNICIDHEGQVHLIDYGFSESLAGRLTHRKGTSSYLSVDYASASKEALDIFALLRTLYLPKKFKTYTQKAKKSRDHHEYILNDDIISKNGLLYALLDTEDGKIKHTLDLDLDTDDDIIKTKNLSALDVTCRLIISRYNLYQRENFFQVFNNPKCFYQSYQYLEILGLTQKEHIDKVFDNSCYALNL
ncbi:protein kinase domain-containing protein [Piscirickettsia salmonis]|uniref:protein kinase domain-containing protein n=1 Tax=Piscirickettsia salmonis TaxID=1238 RepID=UPI003753D319